MNYIIVNSINIVIEHVNASFGTVIDMQGPMPMDTDSFTKSWATLTYKHPCMSDQGRIRMTSSYSTQSAEELGSGL